MQDKRRIGSNTTPFRYALPLVVGLGLSPALPGCADIHPAPDDSDPDMMDESNEGAVHERDHEAESEHVEPGQERPR
jgi:hypothetical protein